jgi:hypothetical protein
VVVWDARIPEITVVDAVPEFRTPRILLLFKEQVPWKVVTRIPSHWVPVTMFWMLLPLIVKPL